MAGPAQGSLFIGIMSGTSLDGADAVLADFSARRPRTLAFATVPFPSDLRDRLLALSAAESDTLDEAGAAAIELAGVYAEAAKAVLAAAGVSRREVRAIGCHGQTVRHRPERGYTLQLNAPAALAEAVEIDIVADFRSRDIAAGGQGAPLVPVFHRSIFQDAECARAVVNIGGISNVTYLPREGPIRGFDCGPGNVLLDAWAQEHIGARFDQGGRWAASGGVDAGLLERLLDDPFFSLPPPKSTGRELFHPQWLAGRLAREMRPQDVQATLAQLTARGIVDAIERFCTGTEEIYLCGGGARNGDLVKRVRSLAGGRRVDTTDALGVPTGHVEALAFAWLAMKCVGREPVELTPVTGSRGPRVLGAIYPA